MNSKYDELYKTDTEIYYNQIFERQSEQDLKNSKREATCHVYGILSKNTSNFLIRNFRCQKAVGWYVKMLKEKKLSTKNFMFGNTDREKRGWS